MDFKWIEKLLPKNMLGEFYETILPGLTFWFWYKFKENNLMQDVNLEEVLRVSFISFLLGNVMMPLCNRIYQYLGELFSETVKQIQGEKLEIGYIQLSKIQEFYLDSNSNLKNNYDQGKSKIYGFIQLTLYLIAGATYMSVVVEFGWYQMYEFVAAILIFLLGVILPIQEWIRSIESYIVNKTYLEEKQKNRVI